MNGIAKIEHCFYLIVPLQGRGELEVTISWEPIKNGVCHGACHIHGCGIDVVLPAAGVDPIQTVLSAIHIMVVQFRIFEGNGFQMFSDDSYSSDARICSDLWVDTANQLFGSLTQKE
ncbi:MAG: hypothetical protein ACK526_02610 [Planctomyces sp.]|jgi:hypothetical protein